MYWYPEVYSADFPVGLYPDFKDPNGGYCQRYNLDEIQNYQPDDLLKASLDLALDHLFNAQGRYNHIARALGLIQDDDRWSLSLNSLSDEEAEAAYQNYATSFVYSLYRQYVQWLIAYKNRYDPSLKSLAAENNPLALRFTKEFDIASKAFSLLWEQHGEGQYFPDEIRVEWLEQSFSLKILELSLNWWAEILSLENWQPLGTYPYFIYLKDDGMYAKLARIFIGRDFQLTQFAHRLYIPNYFALTREKRIGLWDFMSAKYEGIVDTEQKNIVFNRFLSKIRREGKGVSVLDLCCGDGMFGRAYLEGGYSLELQGLDFSPEMLQRARLTGAYQRLHEGNLDDGLNDLPNFDGILLSFAIHLIEENQHLTLFKQVYDKLKMGGIFMLNFYEPLSNWKEAYTHIFQEIGFEVIEIVDEKAGDKDIKAMVLRKNY